MFTIRAAVRVLSAAVATLAVVAASQAGEHKSPLKPGKPVPHQPGPVKAAEVKSPREASSNKASSELAKANGTPMTASEAKLDPKARESLNPTSGLEASTQKNGEKNKKALHIISGLVKIAKGKIDEGYDEVAGAVKKDPSKSGSSPTDGIGTSNGGGGLYDGRNGSGRPGGIPK